MNLNQITIPSLDLEKSVAFYKTLGLHLIVDALPSYARFEAALYLYEYLYGKEIAKSIANGLVIDWDVNKVPHILIKY
jgi:catechol 2,3-dioxygenase-like lactoylglutathione lyase family enzyme